MERHRVGVEVISYGNLDYFNFSSLITSSFQKSEIFLRRVLPWRFPAINRTEGKATMWVFGGVVCTIFNFLLRTAFLTPCISEIEGVRNWMSASVISSC